MPLQKQVYQVGTGIIPFVTAAASLAFGYLAIDGMLILNFSAFPVP